MLKEVFFYRHIVPFNNVVVYSNHIFLNFRTFVLLTPTQSQTSSWTHIETLTNKTEIRDHSNAISRLKFHILLGQATGSDFETCVFITCILSRRKPWLWCWTIWRKSRPTARRTRWTWTTSPSALVRFFCAHPLSPRMTTPWISRDISKF